MKRQYFEIPPEFSWSANILRFRLNFYEAPIFCVFANIFRQAPIFYDFAWFCCCKYLCIFSVFIYAFCVRQYIFGAIVLKPRFKIDVVVMIIWSIVIIINSVFLTLQVSATSLPHDCEPCEIKVVSNHTCSLHTCVCAGSRTPKWLSTARNCFTVGGFPSNPIPVRVCAEHL